MFAVQKFRALCCAGVAGLGLGFLPHLALADETDRVEVRGHALRTDVTRTCPAIGAELAQRLAPAFGRDMVQGDYRVEFRLQGQQLSEVRATGGMWDGRRAIRHAVRGLNCQDQAATPQQFAFLLSVRLDEGSGAPIARLDLKPATLVASSR